MTRPRSSSSPFGPLRLVVNPRAGRGSAGRTLPALRAALDARGVLHDVVETDGPRGAGPAARAALEDGVRYVAAVGGDGTVHEVVNGLLTAEGEPRAPGLVFGVASGGSGCDFARTFGLDRKPEVVARHLASEATMEIDLGVVTFTDLGGRPAQRLFANIAQVGWGADVVRRADRLPRWLGRVRYLVAAYAAIGGLDRQETEVSVAHTSATVPVVDLVVANCQFFGGGMKVAPRALPDDGKFNVQVFTGERSQVFTMTQKIYRGEHLPHPNVVEWQSPTVEIAPPRPLAVEADGELLGRTPATFRLVERALRLKI